MKMTHTVKYRSGNIVKHNFKTKAESDRALQRALKNTWGNISIIQVTQTNKPENAKTYYL